MRRKLTRQEFDERCARLEEIYPGFSETSGRRSEKRNKDKGGAPTSAHLEGLAKDYASDDGEPTGDNLRQLYTRTYALGLWAIYHRGHLHVQGREPGGD